jgi:mRNA-degrading endonuclease HigB of HigAB toxin-antitoxin module
MQTLTGLSEAIDLGLLDPKTAEFFVTDGGFIGLRFNGSEYGRVSLRRSMPLADPDSYISVADRENKEICVIRALNDLSGEQLRIVREELERRYYCPEIKEIKSVKDKMGYVYLELILSGRGSSFEKSCAVKDVNKNIRLVDEDRLIIFDVDGNRYIVPSLIALDKKSRRRLEPYLF